MFAKSVMSCPCAVVRAHVSDYVHYVISTTCHELAECSFRRFYVGKNSSTREYIITSVRFLLKSVHRRVWCLETVTGAFIGFLYRDCSLIGKMLEKYVYVIVVQKRRFIHD